MTWKGQNQLNFSYIMIHCILIFFIRRLRRLLQEDVVRDLCSSNTALQDLESEFNQLQEDREILRRIIPSGNSKVHEGIQLMSCNLLL